jgi:hypothetical protein
VAGTNWQNVAGGFHSSVIRLRTPAPVDCLKTGVQAEKPSNLGDFHNNRPHFGFSDPLRRFTNSLASAAATDPGLPTISSVLKAAPQGYYQPIDRHSLVTV